MAQTFTHAISYSSVSEEELRLKSVQFGDGYQQDAPSGINAVSAIFNVVIDKATDATVTAVLSFFRARIDGDYFFWTPPIPGYGVQIKVKCVRWSVVPDQYGSSTVNATFKQVFVP